MLSELFEALNRHFSTIKLNYQPRVAVNYAKAWLKQAKGDKADEVVVKTLEDLATLAKFAAEHLKRDTK